MAGLGSVLVESDFNVFRRNETPPQRRPEVSEDAALGGWRERRGLPFDRDVMCALECNRHHCE
jgi:hypothetical protein